MHFLLQKYKERCWQHPKKDNIDRRIKIWLSLWKSLYHFDYNNKSSNKFDQRKLTISKRAFTFFFWNNSAVYFVHEMKTF